MDSESRIVAVVQQVPKVHASRKGGDSGGSVKSDSESGHSRSGAVVVVPRTIRKGLLYVEKLCHRGTSGSGGGSSSGSGSGSESDSGPSAVAQDSQGTSTGGIPMTMLGGAASPVPTQDSHGRRGSYAESTLEEVCCSICLSEYVANDRVRVLPCTHEYHAECI
ncbi:hypothetical protein EC991_008631, partial [Linnemannia zychae]